MPSASKANVSGTRDLVPEANNPHKFSAEQLCAISRIREELNALPTKKPVPASNNMPAENDIPTLAAAHADQPSGAATEGTKGALLDDAPDELLAEIAEIKSAMRSGLANNLQIGDRLNKIKHKYARHFKVTLKVLDYKYDRVLNYRRAASAFPAGKKRDRILGLLPTTVYALARHFNEDLVSRALEAAAAGEHVTSDTIRLWAGTGGQQKFTGHGDGHDDADRAEKVEKATHTLVTTLAALDPEICARILVCLDLLGFDVKGIRTALETDETRPKTNRRAA